MSEITTVGDKVIVKPGEDIVASLVKNLKEEMKEVLAAGTVELAIDLSGVEMMDSMGIGVLIAAHNSLKKNGGRLELINVPADILNLLKNMRLDKHFKI